VGRSILHTEEIMPLYDYECLKCSKLIEILLPMNSEPPKCCGEPMTRHYTIGTLRIKVKYPLWVDRMDDIHKAQEQRGERLRFVHPSEIL